MRSARTLSYRRTLVAFGLLSGASACQPLEAIELGACGNQVVEPEFGEDCDGTSPRGTCGNVASDGDVGSVGDDDGVCKFVCDPIGGAVSCPVDEGFRCGLDGICRRPSGAFALGADDIVRSAVRLVAKELGDGFDGTAELLDFDGQEMRVTRFDADGSVFDTQTVNAGGTQVAIGAFSEAEQPSLALRYEASTAAVGVSLFDIDVDGTITPVPVQDLNLEKSDMEGTVLLDAPGRAPLPEDLLLRLTPNELNVDDAETRENLLIWEAATAQSGGVVSVTVGRVFDQGSPCGDVALVADAPDDTQPPSIIVLRLCEGRDFNLVDEEDGSEFARLTFAPGAAAGVSFRPPDDEQEKSSRPLVFFARDPDPDPNLGLPDSNRTDVFVFVPDPSGGDDDQLYVAQQRAASVVGDGNARFGPLRPAAFELPKPCDDPIMECDRPVYGGRRPLAMTDLNGDGAVDIVDEQGILLSRPGDNFLLVDTLTETQSWYAVVVADLTGDDIPDLLVQESVVRQGMVQGDGLLALVNNGEGSFTPTRITTTQVSRFVVDDFDGDGLDDIAFTVIDFVDAVTSLQVSYGRAAGGPAAPVTAAEFDDPIVDLAAGRFRGDDGAADVYVVTQGLGIEGEERKHFLLIGSGTRQLLAPVLYEQSDDDDVASPPVRHSPETILAAAFRTASAVDGDAPIPDLLVSLADIPAASDQEPARSAWTTMLANPERPQTNLWPAPADDPVGRTKQPPVAAAVDLDADGNTEVVALFFDADANQPLTQAYQIEDEQAPTLTKLTDALPLNLLDRTAEDFVSFATPPEPLVVDLDRDGLDDLLVFTRHERTASEPADLAFGVMVELTFLRNRGLVEETVLPFEVFTFDLVGLNRPGGVVAPSLATTVLVPSAPPEVISVGFDLGRVRFENGALTVEEVHPSPFLFPEAVAAADFDGDGLDDIAVATGDLIELYFGVDLTERTGEELITFNAVDAVGVDDPVIETATAFPR
ncbi:MAG: FG-GAP and VCBS repeat-containing protein [Myxococcota bacterium]